MPVDPVDWQIALAFALVVTFLVFERRSAIFLFLAGIMALILAALVDEHVTAAASPFVRYGMFLVLISVGLILVVRAAVYEMPREAR